MSGPPSAPTLTMPADHAGVRAIGPWLDVLLGGLGADEAAWQRTRLELALHEVCVNAVDHAYGGGGGELAVDGWVDEHEVRLRVTDSGRPFDELVAGRRRGTPGVPTERGFGLIIVERLVDDLRYEHVDGRNRWWLTLGRAPDPRTAVW